MEKRTKLLTRIQQGPKSVRFAELVKVMKAFGFKDRPMEKGDGVVFSHTVYAGLIVTIAKPHHGPVLPVYVRTCLNAIEDIAIREAHTDA